MNKEQKKLENWQIYVDEMKDQNSEQYLTGDMEGYRRGYTDGSKVGARSATDLTLAGSLIIALIAGALGILIGLNVAVL